MTLPAPLIDILASHTAGEAMHCEDCKGLGETGQPDPDTGSEPMVCQSCLGSGYNQLGLILQGILKPPPEGFGPVALKDALKEYLARMASPAEGVTRWSRTLGLMMATPTEPTPKAQNTPSRKRRIS